jgi:hypothetical protein
VTSREKTKATDDLPEVILEKKATLNDQIQLLIG